jgi:hypothetical protein
MPTAQVLRIEVAVTPKRIAPLSPLGLGTCFQAVPFQRRIKFSRAKWCGQRRAEAAG